MRKSRKSRGRLTRLGWALAIVLLITPGQVIAGVEWTTPQSEPEGAKRIEAAGSVGDQGDGRTLDDIESSIDRASDDPPTNQLRGSEWT